MLASLAIVPILVAAAFAAESSSPIGREIDGFALQDYRGKTWHLSDFAERKLVVLAFLGVECPLAKLYGPRLAKLAAEFESKGVTFIGIDSNSQDSITELAAYARTHQIAFPLLKDPGNRVADQFGARRTPEVFVLDAERRVRYWGRIDDQYGVGFVRDEPKRHDLRLAIEELLASKSVSVAETAAPGCHIGRVQTPKADASVTYSNQIARLLEKRCVECHRPGEIAPFSLTRYDEVSGWAETIAEVVAEGRMPPWHADPKYGHFVGDRRLSGEEKRLIRQWVADGAPEGNRADLLKSREYLASGWQLPRQPDLVVPMSEKPFAVPAEGTVKYQFFTADPGLTEDKWIQAAEVRPGNRAVVHHVLVFARNGKLGERFEEGGTQGFLAAYVPGLRAAPYPSGMAKRIPAGSKLIFQVHYTPNGSPQLDLSELGLVFADSDTIRYEVRTSSAVRRQLAIPPGDANYAVDAQSPTAPVDVKLLAMMPHMHLRGKAFRYEAIYPDGRKETLLDVPHYDFNWQTAYRLTDPKELPAGTRVEATARYDNSEQNLNNPDPTITVRWGSQTWEEMMIGYFDIALPRELADRKLTRDGKSASERGAILQKLLANLDANRDGKLSRDEVPDRWRNVFDRIAGESGDVIPLERIQRRLEAAGEESR
jgi:peroxiredoxin/mono/diheme cytochrome c family protein